MNYPYSVNAQETFKVSVKVEYWFVDPTGQWRSLLVSINEANNRTKGEVYRSWVPDLAHVKDQLPQGMGTKTYNLTITSPKMNATRHLVAETYIIWAREFRLFDKKNFDITVLKAPAPLKPEILTNGDFESGLEGWEAYNFEYGGPSLSTIVVHQGKYSQQYGAGSHRQLWVDDAVEEYIRSLNDQI